MNVLAIWHQWSCDIRVHVLIEGPFNRWRFNPEVVTQHWWCQYQCPQFPTFKRKKGQVKSMILESKDSRVHSCCGERFYCIGWLSQPILNTKFCLQAWKKNSQRRGERDQKDLRDPHLQGSAQPSWTLLKPKFRGWKIMICNWKIDP